jgi:hypothetical protein
VVSWKTCEINKNEYIEFHQKCNQGFMYHQLENILKNTEHTPPILTDMDGVLMAFQILGIIIPENEDLDTIKTGDIPQVWVYDQEEGKKEF